MEYQKTYGRYNVKPDFSRCAESVWGGGALFQSQCKRKAVCDPDENGNPTTCKQHSEAARSERRAMIEAKRSAGMAHFKMRNMAPRMRDALQQIADGHNDPRALAKEVLEKLKGDL